MSALYNEERIDKYIETELKYSALIGPFDQNPFSAPLTTLPLTSVPKHNSVDRWTVIELGFQLTMGFLQTLIWENISN